MAYITLANTSKIIFNSDIKSLDLSGEIYKIPIYFFSKYEENSLLAIQELLKAPERYFNEIYVPYQPIDTYTLIYEGQHPSYHKMPTCPRLNARYENFKIPTEIKERGIEEVREFRRWFETVKHLKSDVFVMRLKNRWGIITNPEAFSRDNSGTTEIENLTIEDLEKRIDAKIKAAGKFFYEKEFNQIILRKFSKYTFLAYRPEPIENNDTTFSDEEIKELLKNYDDEFKKPLKRMLIEYYRIKHNPEIEMEGQILEQLGFSPCALCHNVIIDL